VIYTFSQLEKLGRLGNQLWQVASTIGLARMAGHPARFRPDWEYRPYFSVPDEYFEPVPGGYTTYDRKGEFLQELDLWWFMREEILDLFRPDPSLVPELDERWDYATHGARHVTAIHVRRGDYLLVPKRFPICSEYYYRTAMDLVVKDHPDTLFLVFSDDIKFCEKHLFKGMECTFVSGVSRPVELNVRYKTKPQDYWDLFLMARCTEHIISNSSYSWWGAILAGNERAIYPSVWYGPELRDIQWEPEMILDTWRKIAC
jgi:hypothetical protein